MGGPDLRSKKRSGASSSSTPPPEPPPTLFIDRSLGRRIVPGILKNAGLTVEIHDDHCPPDAPDEVWLRLVGETGWLALTKDRGLPFRAPSLLTIWEAKSRIFVLTGGDLTGEEMGQLICAALPRMARFARHEPAPFLARVTRSGMVGPLLSAGALRREAQRLARLGS
jgi:hypothetical protein